MFRKNDPLMPKAKSKEEERYIWKRKIKAYCNSLCFILCRIFPIKKNLVSVCTFEGKGGFGCNPKYIVQELHKQNSDIEFVWFVNPDIIEKKEFPSFIKKVPNTLWSRAYWLTRSKVWIDNYRKPYGTIKRKGQYYLNTNHYTEGIKSVGLWRGDKFSKMAYLVSKNDSDMIDDLIIDSEFGIEMVEKGLLYTGHLLNIGSPRCEILYGDRTEYRELFRKRHGLPSDAKVVMFAPTFREGAKNGVRSVRSEVWSIDFARLISNLGKKFGGEWYICYRVHPQLAASFTGYTDEKVQNRMIDESNYDDMYELLAGMDVFITDYSSACFEAAYARIPVFIYADDLDQYVSDRGSLFWEMTEKERREARINKKIFSNLDVKFPFYVCIDNDELEREIVSFDRNRYWTELDGFERCIEKVSGRNACKLVCKIVMQKIE